MGLASSGGGSGSGQTAAANWMMGITARGDVGLDAAFRTGSQRRGAEIAGIQRRRLGRAERGRDGLQRGFGFLLSLG